MGEETPGPGAYMPSSTFGKFASKSNKQFANRASPEFRSKSDQRPKEANLGVPGAGTYTVKHAVIEKKLTNPGSSMQGKAERFLKEDSLMNQMVDATQKIGPGQYNSHVHNSLQQQVEKRVGQMSRQNPGFGIAGPAHKLPHEQPVEDDKEMPGPGKYEQKSNLLQGSGHSSSFKQPTERPKLKNLSIDGGSGTPKRGKRAASPKPAAAKSK
jgi:hypothetical protein